MIKRFVGGTAALALCLSLGAGVANATDDRPLVGTADCTKLVNGSGDILVARAAVQDATKTLNGLLNPVVGALPVDPSAITAAKKTLTEAQVTLRVKIGKATSKLCRTAPEPVKTVTQAPHAAPVTTHVHDHDTIEHTNTIVVPTRDDGSTATGNQVTVVPEGSASTGEA